MNHNTLPTGPNPFAPETTATSVAEAEEFAKNMNRQNSKFSRLRRAAGDKILKWGGKGNKLAQVSQYGSAEEIRTATGNSIDAVLSDYGRSTKRDQQNANLLAGQFGMQDQHNRSKQGVSDAVARLDGELAKLYRGENEQVRSGSVTFQAAEKHIKGLKQQEEAKLAELQGRDGAYEGNIQWAAGVVGGDQLRNNNYNPATPHREVKPEDMPGYNPFAPNNMQSTTPARPQENPFAAQSYTPPQENPFR